MRRWALATTGRVAMMEACMVAAWVIGTYTIGGMRVQGGVGIDRLCSSSQMCEDHDFDRFLPRRPALLSGGCPPECSGGRCT